MILSGIVLGLFLAVIVFLNPLLNHYVKPDLENRINSQKGHHIKIDDLSFAFFSNTISSTVINYTFKDADIEITAGVPEIRISGIPWLNIFNGSSLSFSEVRLTQPDVRIQNLTNKPDDSRKNIIDQLRDIIPEEHKPLRISALNIYEGRFRVRKHNASEDDYLGNINLSVGGIHIHNKKESESIPLKLANSVTFTSDNLLWTFPEKGYYLKIDSINFSSLDSTLGIRNLSFKSPKSPVEFFQGRKYRSNKILIELSRLQTSGIDLPGFINEDVMSANTINVSGVFLEFLVDKRIPRDPAIIPQMPHELISSIENKLNIGSLRIRDSEIHLKELWSDKLISHLPFTKLRADIFNLSSYAGIKYPVVLNVSALLADAGKIEVRMNLPLDVKELIFDYEGSLDKMSAIALNTHLKVADKTELTSGRIGNVTFKVSSRGEFTTAGVVPVYNDLKVKTLTKESSEGGAWQDIKSFFANNIKIRESNPDKDGKIKSGNVVYKKENRDYFLDIVWFSIRDALGEVVGF